MKTYIASKNTIKPKWYIVDADGQILGRLAVKVANLLRGKGKPEWSPYKDIGDFVVVINASKIKVTGKKMTDKKYYRHSGYPGGLKTETLSEKMAKKPQEIIRQAVWGMIPHNRLGRKIINKLKVFTDEKHRYQSQKPETYKI
jgi:large subunit ribosomal protein L13